MSSKKNWDTWTGSLADTPAEGLFWGDWTTEHIILIKNPPMKEVKQIKHINKTMVWLYMIYFTCWSADVREAVGALAGDEVGMEVRTSVAVIGIRWRTILGENPGGTCVSSSACNSKPGLLLPRKARDDTLCVSFLGVQTD